MTTLSDESKVIVRDRLLNDLALMQAWASLLAKQDSLDVEDIKMRAGAVTRLSYHYENDFRELFDLADGDKAN